MITNTRRLVRTGKALVKEKNLPKGLVAVLFIGLLPIPCPIDELALVVGLIVAFVFYRDILRDTWDRCYDEV